jgi:hypothetical protein
MSLAVRAPSGRSLAVANRRKSPSLDNHSDPVLMPNKANISYGHQEANGKIPFRLLFITSRRHARERVI